MPETILLGNALSECTNLPRKRRYTRSPSGVALASLTPVRVEILCYLAELRFLSLPQIARLCCPSERQDLSEKSTRRHMRTLFDSGLVGVLPVTRAAIASFDIPNDASLLYGSAPNIYILTKSGSETLQNAGLIGWQDAGRRKANYGPKNSLFLAHELAVRDVRVWLERSARTVGHVIEYWFDGQAAVIDMEAIRGSTVVRPDAWFVYRLGEVVLVGLVEVDRGTERGHQRWIEKIAAYSLLFESGELLTVTGYRNARLLIATSNGQRRDQLLTFIEEFAQPSLASRIWLSSHAELTTSDLTSDIWRRPYYQTPQRLIHPG